MCARQMVFLAFQVNKTIQKTSHIGSIKQFCTILSNIFKPVVGRQAQLRWKPVKKYFEEIGFKETGYKRKVREIMAALVKVTARNHRLARGWAGGGYPFLKKWPPIVA